MSFDERLRNLRNESDEENSERQRLAAENRRIQTEVKNAEAVFLTNAGAKDALAKAKREFPGAWKIIPNLITFTDSFFHREVNSSQHSISSGKTTYSHTPAYTSYRYMDGFGIERLEHLVYVNQINVYIAYTSIFGMRKLGVVVQGFYKNGTASKEQASWEAFHDVYDRNHSVLIPEIVGKNPNEQLDKLKISLRDAGLIGQTKATIEEGIIRALNKVK